jgi:hypothetical protein
VVPQNLELFQMAPFPLLTTHKFSTAFMLKTIVKNSSKRLATYLKGSGGKGLLAQAGKRMKFGLVT